MDIEQRIQKIEERNKRVEMDKAWETSWTRRSIIALFTYIVIVLFFIIAKLDRPLINSIVPTLGFLLSTSVIGVIKKIWVRKIK